MSNWPTFLTKLILMKANLQTVIKNKNPTQINACAALAFDKYLVKNKRIMDLRIQCTKWSLIFHPFPSCLGLFKKRRRGIIDIFLFINCMHIVFWGLNLFSVSSSLTSPLNFLWAILKKRAILQEFKMFFRNACI